MSSSEDESEIRERILKAIEKNRRKRPLDIIDENKESDFSTPASHRKFIKQFHLNHDHAEGTTVKVYEAPDHSFKLNLIRKKFLVQENFKHEDGLYALRIQHERDKNIRLVPLYNAIFASVEAAADNLKEAYVETKGKHRQLFICIQDQRITGGLNTGAISLDSPSEDIAQITIDILANFLQSHQEFKLEEGFEISFKVVSPAHEDYRRLKDGFVPDQGERVKVRFDFFF